MTTGTRLVVLLLLVGTFCVEAEDVTCGNDRKTNKKVTIKDRESFSFKTQAGAEYGGRVKCQVTYKRDESCPAMKFSCETFALSSTKDTCKKGDKMIVVADGANQKYCQNNSPDVTTTGKTIKVKFNSNKDAHDEGAVCRAECVADATTPTTPITSTTTPTIPTTMEGGCPGCAVTVEVDSTVQSLANFAVNHVDFPAVFSQGCEEDIVASVLSVSSQVVAGTIYTLDLEVQTSLGEECDLVHTRVCRGIKIFKPLPFQCQAASSLCAELSNAPDVTCTEGEIESVGPIEPPVGCICPAQYEPVCGVDGETYSNTCEAGCVGVSVERPGECGPVPVPGSDLCLAVFTPVCGQDGKTYSNNCQAAAAGVEVVSSGACVSEPIVFPGPGLGPGCICTFQFEPVCGEDGQTYSNSCQAGCDGVEVASPGEC